MIKPPRGPVVIDTDVYSAGLISGSPLARLYDPLVVGRPALLSFQTVAELRYGARLRGWGSSRLGRLEAEIAQAQIIHTGSHLVRTYVDLRVSCERVGHALAQREHDADRWIAATAVRLGIPLVSHDRIFEGTPDLSLEAAR